MNRNRLLSLLLIAVMIISLFTGCGKEKAEQSESHAVSQNPSQGETDETTAPFAWKAQYVPLLAEDGKNLNYVNQYCVEGDELFYLATYVTGTEKPTDPETGEPVLDENTGEPLEYEVFADGLFRMSLTDFTVSLIGGPVQPELPEGYQGSAYVQTMVGGGDGTLWLLEQTSTYYYDLPEGFDPETDQQWNYYVEGENYVTLRQCSRDGETLKSVRLALPEGVYVSRLLLDGAGNIYTVDWEQMYIFSPDGTLLHTLTHEQGINEPVKLADGRVGISTWTPDYEKTVFLPADPVTGTFGEAVELATNAYQIQPGSGEYLYYYGDSDSVYGVTDGPETKRKLLSWLDCDVDSNNLDSSATLFLPDGRIAAVERSYSAGDGGAELILLEQVDASAVPQKQELVLGCFGLDWKLRPMIVKFNRSSDDVRIVVRDYSEYLDDSTFEDVMQRMNTEILSGSGPDLLSLGGLPLDQYAAQGLLLDLWPMIDSDPELTRDDLMTHFFDVLSIDGKLYQVADSFTIQTAACRTAITGDRDSWTLEAVLEAMEGLQPDAGIFSETDTKVGILQQCLGYNLDTFFDWVSGTCSFDSDEFVGILEFANTFPAEMDPNYDWATAESEYSRLQNGKQLMTTCYLSNFTDLQVQYALHGGDVNFIGFPSNSGTGSCFQTGCTVSISTSCADPDAAWQFVRRVLLEENQTEEHTWSFPSNKKAFEAAVEKAMTPTYYTDPETGEQVEQSTIGYGIGNDFHVDIYAMKQPEYDAFLKLYNNVKTLYSYDQSVMEIILEECQFFFAGEKTARATADMIQNRLSLYLAEQG